MFSRGFPLFKSSFEFKAFLSEIDDCMRNKVPIEKIAGKLGVIDEQVFNRLTQREMIDFSFICARLHKYSPKLKSSPVLMEKAEDAILRVDIATESPETVSRFLWSCASLGIRPYVPANIGGRLCSSAIQDRDYCTIIWALSKFASPDQPEIYSAFTELVDNISEEKANRLSDEDIINLLRSISVVYTR